MFRFSLSVCCIFTAFHFYKRSQGTTVSQQQSVTDFITMMMEYRGINFTAPATSDNFTPPSLHEAAEVVGEDFAGTLYKGLHQSRIKKLWALLRNYVNKSEFTRDDIKDITRTGSNISGMMKQLRDRAVIKVSPNSTGTKHRKYIFSPQANELREWVKKRDSSDQSDVETKQPGGAKAEDVEVTQAEGASGKADWLGEEAQFKRLIQVYNEKLDDPKVTLDVDGDGAGADLIVLQSDVRERLQLLNDHAHVKKVSPTTISSLREKLEAASWEGPNLLAKTSLSSQEQILLVALKQRPGKLLYAESVASGLDLLRVLVQIDPNSRVFVRHHPVTCEAIMNEVKGRAHHQCEMRPGNLAVAGNQNVLNRLDQINQTVNMMAVILKGMSQASKLFFAYCDKTLGSNEDSSEEGDTGVGVVFSSKGEGGGS